MNYELRRFCKDAAVNIRVFRCWARLTERHKQYSSQDYLSPIRGLNTGLPKYKI
jgi:hypothetical protein